jgi:hypothetical protein
VLLLSDIRVDNNTVIFEGGMFVNRTNESRPASLLKENVKITLSQAGGTRSCVPLSNIKVSDSGINSVERVIWIVLF